jgi:hypothetical protein
VVGLLGALALVAPGSSAAAPTRYVLKHPKRERCKRHYSRVVKRVHGRRRVFCVRHKATSIPGEGTPTSAGLIVVHNAFTFSRPPNYFTIEGEVYAGESLTKLTGQPVVVTITDTHTGHRVASFVLTSNAPPCAVVLTYNSTMTERKYTGEAAGTVPPCPLPSLTVPAADVLRIAGSYAGNARYAPSTGKPEPF